MVEKDYTTGYWLKHEENEIIFSEGPYLNRLLSSCQSCTLNAGYRGFAPVCERYPKGILPEIWLEKVPCPHFSCEVHNR